MAPKVAVPPRPPPMPFTELPVYKTPHHDYKAYTANEYLHNNPGCNKKLIYSYLHPKVKQMRCDTVSLMREGIRTLRDNVDNTSKYFKSKAKNFVGAARRKENSSIGDIAMITSTVAGFIVGRKMGRFGDSLLKGIFGAGVGYFTAGALFKPNETDDQFRELCYKTAETGLNVLSNFYDTNVQLGPVMCKKDLDESPKFCKFTKICELK